ncbi:hypothetical protein BAE44_0020528 [Dichanthelium oligosanthes]|uniref:14-3-3 domain-containing protein n=1 Tax=Dichanthelium oligosanthes TaxID=888268 RepID=A0A1E5V0B2_9POAL|nr:hypothetical protein BAE44_0020528 [Dichanthelium oligosanthes]
MVGAATACRLGAGKEVPCTFLRQDDNLLVWTAMVDMHGKCWSVMVARKVFGQLSMRNLLYHHVSNTWTAFSGNVQPDGVTCIGVLCACARACLGLLEDGRAFFGQMSTMYNLKPTFAHYWCRANLYGSVLSIPEDLKARALGSLLGLCRFGGNEYLGNDMFKHINDLAANFGDLSAAERNLLCIAYKKTLHQKYRGLQTLKAIEASRSTCTERLGDICWYKSMVAKEESKEWLVQKAATEYEVMHPEKLSIQLNLSALCFDELHQQDRALLLVTEVVADAIQELDSLTDDSFKESAVVLDLLLENFTMWSIQRANGPAEVDLEPVADPQPQPEPELELVPDPEPEALPEQAKKWQMPYSTRDVRSTSVLSNDAIGCKLIGWFPVAAIWYCSTYREARRRSNPEPDQETHEGSSG